MSCSNAASRTSSGIEHLAGAKDFAAAIGIANQRFFDEIDRAFEERFERVSDRQKTLDRHDLPAVRLNQNIHVTSWLEIASQRRAKDGELAQPVHLAKISQCAD